MGRYALIIGIEKYENFRNLGKAYEDAKAFAAILREHGGYHIHPFPKRLNKSEKWELAPDKTATKRELQEELRVFIKEIANGQDALIYFAGHGFEVDSLSGGGALATSDTTKDKERAITFHDLNNLVYQADLSSLVVIIDCCYSGQLLERNVVNYSFQSFLLKKDYYFLTGCRPFELAREGSEHGIFTKAILSGLSDKYADEDGQIGTDRLFDYVSKELRDSGQEPIRLSGGRSINLVSYKRGKILKLKSTDETCPYQGLKAFDKSQAKFFFGRENLIQEICQKLDFSNFVPLIGASGSGKSSLVRAGVIPWLEKKRNWNVLDPILPGIFPKDELVRLLPDLLYKYEGDTEELRQRLDSWEISEAERILIFIDQFEEVFTVCSNPKERTEFLDIIADIVELQDPRLSIILTLRADFIEPCLNYPRLSRLIEKQPSLITPLVGEALERAIRQPALVQGYEISEGLLGEIFKDINKEKECLPLIQFTLTELWNLRNRDSKELTAEHYRSLGDQTYSGLIGTLNKHAEKVYASLKDDHYRYCAKKIFLKLVKAGIDSKDTRQRQLRLKLIAIPREENILDEDFKALLGTLIDGRLLVSGKNQNGDIWIDLVHEALMDGWERFSEWLKDNRLLRRLIARIEDEFLEWERSNQRNENLLMGGLLFEARENEEDLKSNLGSKEFSFYQVSNDFARRKEADELRAKENEKNTIKTLQTRIDDLDSLVSLEPIKGLISILEVANQSANQLGNKTPGFLLKSLLKANLLAREIEVYYGKNSLRKVCFDVKDRIIFGGDEKSQITCWHLSEGRRESFLAHNGVVTSLVLMRNDNKIVSIGSDRTIKLWNKKGKKISDYQVHEDTYQSDDFIYFGQIALNQDETLLAIGDNTNSVIILDIYTKNLIVCCADSEKAHQDWVNSVAFNPHKPILVSVSDDTTLKAWDLSGQLIRSVSFHSSQVKSVTFSSDGKYCASADQNGVIAIWNADDFSHISTICTEINWINHIDFHPYEEYILSAHGNGMICIWDLKGNSACKPLKGHDGWVNYASFSDDGNQVVSCGRDTTIRLWDSSNLNVDDCKNMVDDESDPTDINEQLNKQLKIACHRLKNHPSYLEDTEISRGAREICKPWLAE